ncbi:MAG: sulfurtransferase-like selenium metabolism protein YedF [Candidatus Zixiibacteriota bacterium]
METDKNALLIVKSSGIGEGEVDLAGKLAASFFDVLSAADTVPARIVFMNSGVFLTTVGSPVLEAIRKLEQRGVEILSCKSCLDYYGRTEKVLAGRPTNMNETVKAMFGFDRVVSL